MFVMSTAEPTRRWCVGTGSGQRYILDYAGNGGFGPVSVWSNGLLVPVADRHVWGRSSAWACAVCADPALAHLYLPPLSWRTPDLRHTSEPGSGDPNRGTFAGVVSGGPGYRRMRVSISRRDWWHHWRPYAEVDLDPHGDWAAQFNAWRGQATGYLPDPVADQHAVRGVVSG